MFRQKLISQFQRPQGPLGHVIGWVLANRRSNIDRNRWTVDLLNIHPNSKVLEIGCGPGVALAFCANKLRTGSVTGIDFSDVMIAQAGRRNRKGVADGRIRLVEGDILDLEEAGYDRIFSSNVAQLWAKPVEVMAGLHELAAPDAVMAHTYMSRMGETTRDEVLAVAQKINRAAIEGGWTADHIEELATEPLPTFSVICRA